MKLVLIGFMGTGKTSVAKKLAVKTGLSAVEMDHLIVKKAGKSIPKIFEEDGETAFRELEQEVAKEISVKDDGVISAGGGVVMNNVTMGYLKTESKVIYLKTSFEEIVKRVGGEEGRPLFKDHDSARKLYKLRRLLYRLYADVTVDTDGKTIEDIVDEINDMTETS